jgi:V/A-type H+-transporting ATPase subunit K
MTGVSEVLAYVGLGSLGLGLAGSAIGLSIACSAVVGMREERRAGGLAVAMLPGTQGLYAFAVGFLCLDALAAERFLVVFACTAITSVACLVSGWWQGHLCAAGIRSINADRIGMGPTMLMAVFPEFYAILGLAFSALLLFA